MFKSKQSMLSPIISLVFTLSVLLAGWLAVRPVAATSQVGTTLTVGPSCAYPTVQAAVDVAVNGDEIHVAAGTFSLDAAQVRIDDMSLTIVGGYLSGCHVTSLASATILDATGRAGSVVTLEGATADRTVVLSNMVIRGGAFTDGGGLHIGSQFAVELYNVTVRDNYASRFGGGVYISATVGAEISTSLLLFNSAIITNTADDLGGGIFSNAAVISMAGTSAVGKAGVGNKARIGGGITVQGVGSAVVGSDLGEISFNHAYKVTRHGGGGGVYARQGSQLMFSDGFIIQGNSGGGIYAGDIGTLVVLDDDVSVVSNTLRLFEGSQSGGGGLNLVDNATAIFRGSAQVSYNVVTGNNSRGAGVRLANATLTMTEQTVIANNGGRVRLGGGVSTAGGRFAMLGEAEIHHNVGGGGGGAFIGATTHFVIQGDRARERPRLHHNRARVGGGIYMAGWDAGVAAPVFIMAADIDNNSAINFGGGIYLDKKRSVNLVNILLEENRVTDARGAGGGMYLVAGAEVVVSAEINAAVAGSCASVFLPSGRYCSQFNANQADYGAAVYLSGAILTITQTALTENVGNTIVDIEKASFNPDFISTAFIDTVLVRDNVGKIGGAVLKNINLGDGENVTNTATLKNNTIYRNAGYAIYAEAGNSAFQIDHSVIWDNGQGAFIDPSVAFSSVCNITQPVEAGSAAFAAADDSGADPMLANWVDGGYLTQDSPAVDACAAGGGGGFDLMGRPRPLDGDGLNSTTEYDRGAFEFDPAATPTAVQLVEREAAVGSENRLLLLLPLLILLTIVTTRPDKRY